MKRKGMWLAILAIGATLVLAACGGGTTTTISGPTGTTTAPETTDSVPGAEATSTTAAAQQPKVALVMESAISQPGFGNAFLAASETLKKDLGDNYTLADNVPPAEYESTVTQLAQRGYNLIIFDSAVFTGAAQRVAAKFPDTQFSIINGEIGMAPNLSSFTQDEYADGYLTGIVAAYATKSNKVGLIVGTLGGTELPPIQRLNKGIVKAMKDLNPSATATITPVQSFNDPAGAADAATAQFGQGIDVIWACAGGGDSGVFKTATRMKGKVIGYGQDMSVMAPGETITSMLVKYSDMVLLVVKKYQEGTLTPTATVLGLDTNMFELAPINNLDAATVAKIQDAIDKLKSGDLQPPTS